MLIVPSTDYARLPESGTENLIVSASEAVWEGTPFFPASVRPDLRTIMGFVLVTCLATSMNLLPPFTDSRYMQMTFMFSSCSLSSGYPSR